MARREKGQEEATGTLVYAPGEIIEKLMGSGKKVSSAPSDMDIILYIEYILKRIPIKDRQKVTINEGQIYIGYRQRAPYRFLVVEDGATQQEIFLAGRTDSAWEILVTTPGKWREMLEYAFDKVRTSMSSLDRFITEFPPIGIA